MINYTFSKLGKHTIILRENPCRESVTAVVSPTAAVAVSEPGGPVTVPAFVLRYTSLRVLRNWALRLQQTLTSSRRVRR